MPEVETTDPEEQEQDVYPPRSEDEILEVISSMEDVDDVGLEDKVRQISELADDSLRTGDPSVMVHADAPIRSLVNPDENTVEIQEGYRQDENTILSNPEAVEAFNKVLHDQEPPTKEAELVGEEYYMAQTLPGFQDVGNIKWWTLMDEGSYREEARGRGREHLNLENEGEIYGYRIELDGEPLSPEQVQNLSLMMNIRDSEDSGLERNRIPELIIRYDSTEEVLESEDIDESDYLQQIQEAQRDGLITEEGDLTLKGLISTADMQARDLRRLEELDGDNSVTFDSLDHSDIPFMSEDDVVGHDATLSLNAGSVDQRSEEGRVERGELQGELAELAGQIEDLTGFRIEDTTEGVEEDYSVGLRDLYSSLRGQEIPEDVVGSLEGEMRDNIIEAAASNGSVLSVSDPEYSFEIERGDFDELEDIIGYHPDRIEQELNENTSVEITYSGVRLVYEGDDEGMVAEVIDGLRGTISGFSTEVEDGRISTNIDSNRVNESYLELIDRLEDPVEHPIAHQYGMIGRITSYEETDQEFRDTIEELEEEGLIETELRWGEWADATVKPTAKNPLEYREAIQTIEELDFVETPKKTQRWEERTRVDLDDVMVEMEVISDDDEKVSKILGDAEEELREKANIPFTHESEMVPDYEHHSPSNLTELVNKTLEAVDSEYLTGLARKVFDEPEMEEKRSFPSYISNLNEEVEDYDHGYSDELVESLRELQEQGMLDVQREIRGHGPQRHRSMEYTDINGEARVDYSDLEEDQIEELRRLETQGLIELDEPLREMRVTDLGESEHRYSINVDMKAEEVDIDGVEDTVRIGYFPGDEQVYEVYPRLKEIGDWLDPLNLGTEPYEEVTVENQFDYGKALV